MTTPIKVPGQYSPHLASTKMIPNKIDNQSALSLVAISRVITELCFKFTFSFKINL